MLVHYTWKEHSNKHDGLHGTMLKRNHLANIAPMISWNHPKRMDHTIYFHIFSMTLDASVHVLFPSLSLFFPIIFHVFVRWTVKNTTEARIRHPLHHGSRGAQGSVQNGLVCRCHFGWIFGKKSDRNFALSSYIVDSIELCFFLKVLMFQYVSIKIWMILNVGFLIWS